MESQARADLGQDTLPAVGSLLCPVASHAGLERGALRKGPSRGEGGQDGAWS